VKLDTFSMNVWRYSQNHALNCIFLGHPMGALGAIYALYLKVLTQRNLKQSFIERMSVLHIKQRISISEPPLGEGLRGKVCDSFFARWKACSRLHIGYN